MWNRLLVRATRAFKDGSIPELPPISHPDRRHAGDAPRPQVAAGPRRLTVAEFEEQHMKEVPAT